MKIVCIRTILGAACLVWLAALGPAPAAAGEPEPTPHAVPPVIDERALSQERLARFYARRDHRPVWFKSGALNARGWAALSVLGGAFEEGLDPAKYFFGAIQARVAALPAPASGAGHDELDSLISAGLLGYLADVSAGRLAPWQSDPELFAYPNPADPVAALEAALRAPDLAAALRRLAPPHESYRRLRAALARYRGLADHGGWPSVPAGPKLELGDRDPRVRVLWARLRASNDVHLVDEQSGDLFNAILEDAVLRFQARHGLDIDGIVGRRTLAALNVSIEARIRQIQVNMERWRWLPRRLGARYALINAAGFTLRVVEDGIPRMEMAVVVGRPHRRTPIFNSAIGHMILNPDWTVPRRIARRDLLPKIRRDPDYLARQGFQVWSDWSQGARLLDPARIDWQAIDGRRFRYKLRQLPGPGNALGRVKFMLPNSFNVYLHDTPNRELFRKTARPFSSGCVRLSRPIDFAEYLMAAAPDWDRARIEAEVASGKTRRVNLPVSLPVYFTYFTAWVGEAGDVQFRNDIYERDKALLAALIDQLIIQTSRPAGQL
jgi:murein L,D-transpeptidase YcbB/YkuD